MSKPGSQQIVKDSLEERRERQYRILKAYSAGKVTPNQAIDAINNMEKIIYIGNKMYKKQEQQKKPEKKE